MDVEMGSIISELKESCPSAAAVRLKNHTEAERFPRPRASKPSADSMASRDEWSSYRAIAVACGSRASVDTIFEGTFVSNCDEREATGYESGYEDKT